MEGHERMKVKRKDGMSEFEFAVHEVAQICGLGVFLGGHKWTHPDGELTYRLPEAQALDACSIAGRVAIVARDSRSQLADVLDAWSTRLEVRSAEVPPDSAPGYVAIKDVEQAFASPRRSTRRCFDYRCRKCNAAHTVIANLPSRRGPEPMKICECGHLVGWWRSRPELESPPHDPSRLAKFGPTAEDAAYEEEERKRRKRKPVVPAKPEGEG
jgi:hypothetical protein